MKNVAFCLFGCVKRVYFHHKLDGIYASNEFYHRNQFMSDCGVLRNINWNTLCNAAH